KTSIFSHPVYLFLRKFSLQDSRGGSVYKPITLLANTAAEIAVELGNGQEPKADTSLNNGLKDVPSRLLTPIDVNKNNIKDTVIKDGFHKESEL
ncbi:hypothetical protein LAV75_15400, partial [Shigella flexneri]|nr:hypothetical protein [Shigella flexneri]